MRCSLLLLLALASVSVVSASDKTKQIAVAKAACACSESGCKCDKCDCDPCTCGVKKDVVVKWLVAVPEGTKETVKDADHTRISEYPSHPTAKVVISGPAGTFMVDEIPSTSLLLALVRDAKTPAPKQMPVMYRQVCNGGVCQLVPVSVP